MMMMMMMMMIMMMMTYSVHPIPSKYLEECRLTLL
jgi:hypothetical protein